MWMVVVLEGETYYTYGQFETRGAACAWANDNIFGSWWKICQHTEV